MGHVSFVSFSIYAVADTVSRSSFERMDWYAGKGEIREYLKEVNKDSKVVGVTDLHLIDKKVGSLMLSRSSNTLFSSPAYS